MTDTRTTPSTAARVSGTIKARADLIRDALRFANLAAGEGIEIGGIAPEDFMADYTLATDDDDWDTIHDRILAAIQPDAEPQAVAWRISDRTHPGWWTYYDHEKAPPAGAQPLYATPSSAGTVSVEAAGWRPIETAPMDGSEFMIAYSDGIVRAGRFLDNSHTRWPWKGVRPMYGAERAGSKITHWMPFPESPALRALAGKGGAE